MTLSRFEIVSSISRCAAHVDGCGLRPPRLAEQQRSVAAQPTVALPRFAAGQRTPDDLPDDLKLRAAPD